MEIPIYSFEGTMELYEWFQWLEEYFDYANIQNERDKTLTAALHLTGQAYAWVRRNYEYWTPSFPWDTFENFREELEFEEKWNYKERKALELEYYNNIAEEAWGVEDDDFEFETVNVEFKVDKQYSSFAVDNMNSLAYPDFSVNNLTGDIPRELGFILETLKYFKFSYNNMTICWSNELVGRFPMAFRGVSSSYPIAANPHFLRDRGHRSSRLALALGIGLGCLLAGLVDLAMHARRRRNGLLSKWPTKKKRTNLAHFYRRMYLYSSPLSLVSPNTFIKHKRGQQHLTVMNTTLWAKRPTTKP
eukprot:Gb_22800 [translate_table: standard]